MVREVPGISALISMCFASKDGRRTKKKISLGESSKEKYL